MNYEYFIAKRITGSKSYKSSISGPIIKIGIVAIAIGLIVMLIAISTGTGLQKKIREKAIAFNGHVILSNFDNNTSEESQFPISINQEFYPEFKEVEGVKHIQGVASKSGVIRTENDIEGIILKGVGKDYDWHYFEEYLIEGRLPEYSERTNNDVIMSSYTANRLGLQLNDSFEMVFLRANTGRHAQRRFNIVGIFSSGFQDLDKTFLLGDIRHIQRINSWKDNEIGSFEIFIDNFDDLDVIGTEVYQKTPSTLKTEKVSERYAVIFEWVKIFDKNIYGIIVIMIIVAGINMITALLVLILERTQMIGILKALGSNNWSVRKMFLYNASYLVLRGLFWGNIIGLSFLFIQKQFKLIKFPNPEEYNMTYVPVYLNLDYILLLNIGTFIMCFIMLLVPSYIITKISPVKAIRFE